jgi:hypothetical protein
LTITRTTSNRKLQLKQLFTRDAAEQELKIEMTVKNVSSSSLTNVKLNRYFDGDSNVDAEDIYFTTRRSVIEGKQGPDISAGLVMMCLTPPPIGIARAVLFGDWNPFNMNGQGRGCAPSGAIGLIAPFLDWVGVFDANLGPMNAGSSKTVTVVYKRIP